MDKGTEHIMKLKISEMSEWKISYIIVGYIIRKDFSDFVIIFVSFFSDFLIVFKYQQNYLGNGL